MSTITEASVKEHIKSIAFFKAGERTTVGIATLNSGFQVVEHSHVQNPNAYDQEIGESLCRERIYLKVWEFVAYAEAEKTVKSAAKAAPLVEDNLTEFGGKEANV